MRPAWGHNAAWLRLAVMTLNVRTALKRLALTEKWLTARPKRMRFQQKRVQAACRAWHPPAGHASYAASLLRLNSRLQDFRPGARPRHRSR